MQAVRAFLALCLGLGVSGASAGTLVSAPGQFAAIPRWDLQSSAETGDDLAALSKVGVDTSSWHHVDIPQCTLMGCLIESGVYNDTDLFFSDNLRKVDGKQFSVPWLYRNEFTLDPAPGKHYFLYTHGITSRADIFLNGKQVADKSLQSGAYGGHQYEITGLAAGSNALVIRAWPTSYYYDFAIGWVDWNPWPADNGTGVWRKVELKQTGPVALGPVRVSTQMGTPVGNQAATTILATAQNLESTTVKVTATAKLTPLSGGDSIVWEKYVTLQPFASTDIYLDGVVQSPEVWWPKQWGAQPLYNASMTVTTDDGTVSDSSTARFGFRTVTSQVAKNDTTFIVNGKPFQVIGGGYAPDMFLRWDPAKWEKEVQYLLDLGFNAVRLEGKNQHPEFYDIADRLGAMILPGWECCDKWESWTYNDNLDINSPWTDADYATANASMIHEASMMQTHPSVLGYLIGSDFWPDDRATPLYLNAFQSVNWQNPILDSASRRGFSSAVGNPGLNMEGPYDWVPPNYWFDNQKSQYGSAYGFGSELSSGAGTPDLSSLKKFLSQADLDDLWKNPNKNLFHMSNDGSTFHNRALYNTALWNRLGAPTSVEDYVQKSQMSDYEATRAQFEAYASMWNAARPATGVIYWMLTSAFPSLHWNIWDFYMRPNGNYFGAKIGGRIEHVAFDYLRKVVYLINRSIDKSGKRTVDVQIIDTAGTALYNATVDATTTPNTSKNITSLTSPLGKAKDVVFLRLVLKDDKGEVLSRNVYWIAPSMDVMDWDKSDWYFTPVTKYSDYTALNKLGAAKVVATATKGDGGATTVTLENQSNVPAFFISLNLVDVKGQDVLPLTWSDNYITLWPKEKLSLTVKGLQGSSNAAAVNIAGKNVAKFTLQL